MDDNNKSKVYIAIDLKSFYASVECKERCLDPLNTNLVVADLYRTNKTICLAVSPSLKEFGIGGRARLFEVVSTVNKLNKIRNSVVYESLKINERSETIHTNEDGLTIGDTKISSVYGDNLVKNPKLLIDYIIAPPRMAKYMEYSKKIYSIYLQYVSSDDIHVYSVDEVFIDATSYLKVYNVNAHEFAMMLINEVLNQTGITATAGIGTNIYLAKIAMDIKAKKMKPDENGVRIAYLDEKLYKEELWNHKPLTDFWRVGRGYKRKLESVGLFTMGDIARCSLGKPNEYYNEDLLFRLFGVSAELLIDHAWGYEPTTIETIKSYKPRSTSLSTGQVLTRPYNASETRIVVNEMADFMSIDLVKKKLLTDAIVLTIGYDIENLNTKSKLDNYKGEIQSDYLGRIVPKHSHGTIRLGEHTNLSSIIISKTIELYDKIIRDDLTIRRINIEAIHTIDESNSSKIVASKQISMFDFVSKDNNKHSKLNSNRLENEKELQKAMIRIRSKYGPNAILKASSLKEEATAIERNSQIGGHKA